MTLISGWKIFNQIDIIATTADLLDNSKFIRFGAIGDGSCLLHAIFTSNKVYYNASYRGKIVFIHKVRKKLADKVRQMTIRSII